MATDPAIVRRFETASSDYFEYADYHEGDDVTRAQKFVTAVRRLIGLLPQRGQLGGAGGENVQFDLVTLQKESLEAKQFIAAKRIALNQYTYTDSQAFRD